MFVAAIFRTTFGFGEALIAVPLLALIIPVKVAAPVAVLASIVIAGFAVLRDWRHIDRRSAGWLLASTLFGNRRRPAVQSKARGRSVAPPRARRLDRGRRGSLAADRYFVIE
jgi:hypothetical protein